ncbi:alpha/beta hydrolase [Bacillus alveayuensis]|jgi:carboxylesterase|uniref:Esterase/lipase n=1 Tax=Aeribacillus alveayuensis TaxID=279215 RepID=A0ABT9VR75_9BACI|nr:alpha/beta fold hydrolase [Bacillus alveayuensis]MDQ0163471.1 esterase/lipase [Bacillus alveayuensis]
MSGCLCIHGFTGAPYEVEPLAEYLRHQTNWDIRVPTLPGHGEILSLSGVRYEEWIEYAEQELQRLMKTSNDIYVIGFSMGGLIASYLAANYPIKKLVLLSAAIYYVNPAQMLADIKEMIRDGVKGNLKENELFQRYKKKMTETPIRATFQFRKLVRFVKPFLKDIKVPTLIVQGELDGIVPVKSAHYLYNVIGSSHKELLFLPNSKHHICHGDDFAVLAERVEKFLRKQKIENLV